MEGIQYRFSGAGQKQVNGIIGTKVSPTKDIPELKVEDSNLLILPGGALTSIAIPLGLRGGAGETIRFNFNSTSTTTHTVRIVEV